MLEIEAILILLVAVAALATLANKIKVSYPILLVLGGLVLGFVPGLPRVELEPGLVFLLFWPPLLYVSAIFTSWRDFRVNVRPISLLAVGLVLMTTCAVAVVVHWAIGLPWAAAFALGAIVSPTDHIPAAAVAQRLGVPRRPTAHSDYPRRREPRQRRYGYRRLPIQSSMNLKGGNK